MKEKYNCLKKWTEKFIISINYRGALVLIIALISSNYSLAQDTLFFKIIDKTTHEIIPFAKCYINGKKYIPINDTYYFFEDKDTLSIEINANTYNSFIQSIPRKKVPAFIKMNQKQNELEEVKIIAKNQKRTDLFNNLSLTKKEIELLPSFLGENDPVKVIQLLPGVQAGAEGNGIFIRGGNNDQNLILFDNVPLYNVSHLFGFFSVFNSNSIKSIDIYKNTIPSKYGGRVSSVLDIKSQPGNLRKWNANINIGVLATNLHIDGPIKKDTSSISLSFRRTYIDLLQNLLPESNQMNATKYYFYDFNFNYFKKINSKNSLYLSSFSGKDNFKYVDQWNLKKLFENKINWNSKFASIQLKHISSKKLSYKTIAAINSYDLNFGASIYNFELNLSSQIRDYILKLEYNYQINNRINLNFGAESILHDISPNNYQIQGIDNADSYQNNNRLYSLESAIYLESNYQFTDKTKLNIGVRVSNFNQLGPFKRTEFNENGNEITSEEYTKGSIIHTYFRPEPRIALNHQINSQNTISLGYNQTFQYLHLAPISNLTLPTDVWISSSSIIKPQKGNQISLGYEKRFKKIPLQFTLEGYYKIMDNLIEYKQGVMSLTTLNSNYDDNFYFGKGESYGIEFYIKKNIGRLNGWISYTLSKSTRNFDAIENGNTFYANNDRRHNLSLVLNFNFSKKWAFSTVFVFQSGNAITIPLSNYFIQGNIINTYSEKNSFRLPSYHRGDVSFTYLYKKTDRRESSLNFSIYNFYGRQNPFYYYFETTGNLDKLVFETKLKQISLITILPSISWKIRFK